MISYPHFYEGDEKLFEFIDGLEPNREKHETFADIHPRLAFPISGASRLQINIQVRRSPSMISKFLIVCMYVTYYNLLYLPYRTKEIKRRHDFATDLDRTNVRRNSRRATTFNLPHNL